MKDDDDDDDDDDEDDDLLSFVVEEQSHKVQNPDMSDEERMEDLSVVLLANLQEKQNTENSTVQNLMHDMVHCQHNFIVLI